MKKRLTALALCAVLLLSGCQIGNRDIIVTGTLGSKQVFKIDGKSCDLKEARVYLSNYQNIYGTAYDINLWEHDFGDDSLVDYVKDVTLDELTRVYCMDLLAQSHELQLTEEEADKVAEAAAEYYAALSEAELSYLEVSKSDIEEYYSHYALAQKIYHTLTDSVNEEVSDDEARVIEIMQIYVSNQTKAEEVAAKLANGEDFAAVANNYNERPVIQITVSRDDLSKEVEEVAFRLDNNEISGMIEADGGYYFLKCLNKYNVDLTEANKSHIVDKREKEVFDNAYNELIASISSSINQKLWDGIVLNTEGEITTDSFFEVFDKYCGEI